MHYSTSFSTGSHSATTSRLRRPSTMPSKPPGNVDAVGGVLDRRFRNPVAGNVGINEPIDHRYEQQRNGGGYDQAEDERPRQAGEHRVERDRPGAKHGG